MLCKVCNDHGKKGPRAAFMFEEDGAAYNCFNCGAKGSYKTEFEHFPKDMREILDAFGVPDDEINGLRFTAMQNRDEGNTTTKSAPSIKIAPKEIELPDHFYKLQDAEPTDKWAEIARFYLEDRLIDPDSYPFYLSTGIPGKFTGPEVAKAQFVKQAQKWKGRVIYPVYKDEKLIFYQGRDLTGKARKKYESPSVEKDRVMFGFDQLFDDNPAPIYVVEGFFDAYPINGIAILGNELSEAQIIWLNKSRREKVYIPDKFGDGAKNAKKALKLGWKLSLPDLGNCKDISEGIVKYGRLFVHNTLRENTVGGFEAQAALNLYCK